MKSKSNSLVVRCLAFKENQQWVAICLPYALCVQAERLEDAKRLLHDQMVAYLQEALIGPDRVHQKALLRRSAPLKYWIFYWVSWFLNLFRSHQNQLNKFTERMPAVPMAC
jgi:hypothetical protein